ncbi:MAG TPA: hypothetical protein VJ302_31960 [Blastocatellia bacterium]|nr:hypothetical protein [Blastocatellia bacterium]
MRFHSTPESALKLEITKLAIIETILAVLVYVGIGFYFGTFKYLATAVVVAPLMLLRTETSAKWGLRVYGVSVKWIDLPAAALASWLTPPVDPPNRYTLIFTLLAFPFVIILALIGTIVRVFATLYWIVRMPLKTLREMPQNWLRQCLCTDFFHVPEILPLEASIWKEGDQNPTFVSLVKEVRNTESLSGILVGIFFYSPIFIIGYLPSLLYRVSFKATAVAYLPFIWVAHATLRNPLPAKSRLERITKGELEKVRQYVSYVIVVGLAAKISLIFGWVEISKIEEKFPIPSKIFIQNVIAPNVWPWWQITLTTDALLSVLLFWFADAAIARIDNKVWGEESVLRSISSISFVRSVLSIATMSHFFWIAFVRVAPASMLRLLGI